MKKIKKLVVGLLICLLIALSTSVVGVQTQMPEFESLENANVDITLELLPDARCHVTVNIEAQFEMEGWGDLPITSGSLSLDVSSPSSGRLKLDVSGSVTLSEAGVAEIPEEITMMNAEMINSYIALSGIEGGSIFEALSELWTMIPGAEEIELPPEMEDIVVESIRCTKFSWREPTLEAGLTTTLSGEIFENEELRDELPINVDWSIDISETSISSTLEASGETGEFTLEIGLTAEDTTVRMELTFDGYFDLPVVEDNVQWSFEAPEMENIPGLENLSLENLGELLKQYDIDFTLKVPEDASVSGLPPGYSQEGDTFTWSGDNAADALDLVLTGEVQGNVTYGYKPPAEFPWLVVGALVVVVVVVVVVAVALRRR